MNTVLCPTDFSDNSLNAIKYAIKFNADKPTRFIILYVIEEPKSAVRVMINIDDKIKQNALDDLSSFKTKVGDIIEQDDIHFCETKAISGSLVNGINDVCKSDKVDIIFMGTQGASGLKRSLMGSVTSLVIREVRYPIIAVPCNASFTTLERIAFAADLEPISDESILLPLIDIVENFKANLMVVNVHDVNDNIKDTSELEETARLKKLLQRLKHSFHYLSSKNPVAGLGEFIEEKDIQLIAMVTRDHTLFNRLFNTSTVEKMSFLTRTPLYAIHN